MRNKMLVLATAAFALGLAGSAMAAPPFADVKKADEHKNPVAADVALSKTEAKDAKKSAHVAKKKAKVAVHKAKVAQDKAAVAAKDAYKAAAGK